MPSVDEQLDERFVDFFDPVVALLVVAVDRALHGGDAGVGHIGAAGDVLFVPQQEVELMLLADGGEQAIVGVVGRERVPAGDGRALQLRDLSNQVVRSGQHVGRILRRDAGCEGRMLRFLRIRGKTR